MDYDFFDLKRGSALSHEARAEIVLRMESSGKTLAEVARLSGLSHSQLSNYVAGRSGMRTPRLARLVMVLGGEIRQHIVWRSESDA